MIPGFEVGDRGLLQDVEGIQRVRRDGDIKGRDMEGRRCKHRHTKVERRVEMRVSPLS